MSDFTEADVKISCHVTVLRTNITTLAVANVLIFLKKTLFKRQHIEILLVRNLGPTLSLFLLQTVTL